MADCLRGHDRMIGERLVRDLAALQTPLPAPYELVRVHLEGACHLWRKIPSWRLSIYLEADERFGWVTVRTAGQAVNIGAGSETIWGNVLSTGGESPNMRCVEDRQTKITKIPPMDEVWEGTGANSQSYRQRLVRNARQALSHLI
jgi:hypothetical protein